MKKVCVIGALLLIMMAGTIAAHSVDTGPITFDAGIPITYINYIDLANAVSSFQNLGGGNIAQAIDTVRELPFRILSNIRVGFELDFLLNVVPDVLGIGVNAATLASYGFHPNVEAVANIIIDIPLRLAFRFGLGQVGYIQVHTGFYLQHIVEAVSDNTFQVFRYVDVGMRVKIGAFSFHGGYLIEAIPISDKGNVIPNPPIPFYAGVFIPIT